MHRWVNIELFCKKQKLQLKRFTHKISNWLSSHLSGRAGIMWSKEKRRNHLPRWLKDWGARADASKQQPSSSASTRGTWTGRGCSTGSAVSNPPKTLSCWNTSPAKVHHSRKWNYRFFFIDWFHIASNQTVNLWWHLQFMQPNHCSLLALYTLHHSDTIPSHPIMNQTKLVL